MWTVEMHRSRVLLFTTFSLSQTFAVAQSVLSRCPVRGNEQRVKKKEKPIASFVRAVGRQGQLSRILGYQGDNGRTIGPEVSVVIPPWRGQYTQLPPVLSAALVQLYPYSLTHRPCCSEISPSCKMESRRTVPAKPDALAL